VEKARGLTKMGSVTVHDSGSQDERASALPDNMPHKKRVSEGLCLSIPY